MKILPLITALATATAAGKNARTYYDDLRLGRARQRLENHEWAQGIRDGLVDQCQWYLDMSLDECWKLVPPAEQVRAINVSHGVGCPDCGDRIFRKAGHYPWILDRKTPFKVRCPVCSKTFPENEFTPWNPVARTAAPEAGLPIRDKGVGWVDADGRRFWFVAYYLFWQRWRQDIVRGVHRLGQAYMLTDDPRYARRAAVILVKLASQYQDFHYEDQVYHEGLWGVRGRISDYIWTCGDNSSIALAYDAVYPVFHEDNELQRFLESRDVEDPPVHVERDMLQVMTDDIMRGYVAGNMGMHQRTLAELAIVLDNHDDERGKTTEQMRTWLMAGGGRIEDLLWNGFWRDGLGGESSPSYASGWGIKFYDLAELLPRLGLDIWSNPKLRKMADIGPDLLVAGTFTPCIGDCGGVRGAKNVGLSAAVHGPAFMRYNDPRYAAALARIDARNRDLWSGGFDAEQVREAAPNGQLAGKTRVLGGYGLAVLESGTDPWRRGVSLYFGDATGGHGHYDRLTLGFFALGYPMFCEMGYPTPFRTPKRFGWTSNTSSHFAVLIDGLRQRNRHAGTLHGITSTDGVQWVDASAERVYPDQATLYRRQTALVDIDEQRSYVLDVLRVTGGETHDWCFHGPAFAEFDTSGLDVGPTQETGTLAGIDVPFGERPAPSLKRGGRPLNLLSGAPLRRGEDYRALSGDAWAAFGDCILTRSHDAGIGWDIGTLPKGPVNVMLDVYDYGENENHFTLHLGDTATPFHIAPKQRGYRWIQAVVTLEAEANTMMLKTSHTGQTYLQIRNIVFSTDLTLRAPATSKDETNGFEFLYHVRRARPRESWSCTWRHPEDGVNLTTHVPQNTVQEAIFARAEPEMQPGNPEYIHVVVGRNRYAQRPGQGTFLSVSEPHRGDPHIQEIQRLDARQAVSGCAAVAVRRGSETDFIHTALDSRALSRWETPHGVFQVRAAFALVTVDETGPRRAVLINGGDLRFGDMELNSAPAVEATVLSVDVFDNVVRVDTVPDHADTLDNTPVIFFNEHHRAAYMVERVEADGNQAMLHLGSTPLRIAMGEVLRTDPNQQLLESDRSLVGYGRIENGRHQGRWIANEAGRCIGRVVQVNKQRIQLEAGMVAGEPSFLDGDGDGRCLYWISEVGPGDRVKFTQSTVMERN